MALPKGCRLHMLATGSKDMALGAGVVGLVSGLTMHMNLMRHLSFLPRKLVPLKVTWEVPRLRNLKQLQLVVNKTGSDGKRVKGGLQFEVCVTVSEPWETSRHGVWHSMMPDLEVLEIKAPCNLTVFIGQEIRLKSLVLIAAGTLAINSAVWYQLGASNTTVKQLYLQSSCDFWPSFLLEPPRNAEYFKEGWHCQCCWKARMPASFQPNNLQECCCNACPECLARAGVPILCGQAWTRDGFKRHLRSQCRKDSMG